MLEKDRRDLPKLLQAAYEEAVRFLDALDGQPAGHLVPTIEPVALPESGLGAAGALETFRERYAPWMSGSAGPAEALEKVETEGQGPAIVVANAGTVNTCDFDDLVSVAALKERYRFWLHVDGAFGAVAAASPRYRPLLAGLDSADSVTVDAHKWLNVAYDAAVVLTRHFGLQGEVFRSAGAYLPAEVRPDTLIHLTPENSQRLRALPTWMTLTAYGRAGYAELVERCCRLASAGWILSCSPSALVTIALRTSQPEVLLFGCAAQGFRDEMFDLHRSPGNAFRGQAVPTSSTRLRRNLSTQGRRDVGLAHSSLTRLEISCPRSCNSPAASALRRRKRSYASASRVKASSSVAVKPSLCCFWFSASNSRAASCGR